MPKVSVLFVCLGNICRSPMAEAVFLAKVQAAGLDQEIAVDSAGTGDWHVGSPPDPRTIRVLQDKGIEWPSRCRQIRSDDFQKFDYLIGMDIANIENLKRIKGAVPEKLSTMLSWDKLATRLEVPDPYHGEASDFQEVYGLVDSATSALLKDIVAKHELKASN